ncbi:MAG: PAS domain-containing protein [Nitrospiraceae bacterium]|nr:MAG: PAS domain-containing protein [Nitrospiraceae bacterium]
MKKRKVFRNIFLYYVIILIISVLFIELYITRVVRENYITNLKQSLEIQANLLEQFIQFRSPHKIDAFCKQLKEKTGARITVIKPDGVVAGDSDQNSAAMENHGTRPEIQQALLRGTGWAIRHSDTLNIDLLYVVKRIDHAGGIEGFIRLAIPIADIQNKINTLRFEILFAVILVLSATGILIIWQTNRIRKLFIQISAFSQSIAQGAFEKKLFLRGEGEFESLAHDLNAMSGELKKQMERIVEETDQLNVILKGIPDALAILNIQGIIQQANTVFGALFNTESVVGSPLVEIIRSNELFSLIDQVRRTLSAGMAEIIIYRPEETYLEVMVSPLFYKEGELSGFVVIFHDTTHMKKLEQLRKDFVANVSHEIKTPVTAIKGFTETLLDGAIDDREHAVNFLNTIKSHSERLNRLIEDLLTISRIELGVIKVDKSSVAVLSIINAVIETLISNADMKDLYLKTSFGDELMTIDADRDRVLQILLNLVDNAIKFTESGGVELGFSQEREVHYFFVKDTGVGIPKKYISRLGERFFRVDPSRSRDLGGTGLGLAIVKHLVKAHGWEMKIESKPGKGTLVKIIVS